MAFRDSQDLHRLHSVEFVNSHTNTPERSHRIIKDWARKQHYNFGASSLELMRNVALQCVKLGDVHVGDVQRARDCLANSAFQPLGVFS